jgi:hypothetical protein
LQNFQEFLAVTGNEKSKKFLEFYIAVCKRGAKRESRRDNEETRGRQVGGRHDGGRRGDGRMQEGGETGGGKRKGRQEKDVK